MIHHHIIDESNSKNVQFSARILVVLPTYNEFDTVTNIITRILEQQQYLGEAKLAILVVDDNSPDNTGTVVKSLSQYGSTVFILEGKKQGLGAAYKRGMRYAVEKLSADIVIEMDADFSHDPNDIPRLVAAIYSGEDMAIGSRYVQGGSLPSNWPLKRKLNSKFANILAKFLLKIHNVQDTTGGFRAIRSSLISKIGLHTLVTKGYVFQVEILYRAINKGAAIAEIPIHFSDRERGQSKMSISDIREFILALVKLRFYRRKDKILFTDFLTGTAIGATLMMAYLCFINMGLLPGALLLLSSIMSIQGGISLMWLLFAWDNPETVDTYASPKKFLPPNISFTALVPARHETNVIGKTIEAISRIRYPNHLKHAVIICRADDASTIAAAQETIDSLRDSHITLHIYDDEHINKPHALNIGLASSTGDVVVVFDAEDEPHPDIYHVANTTMHNSSLDGLQCGVQLMNYHSSWFALFSVLEYFFWFKSGLLFFTKIGRVTPLAGNTVFIKREWLNNVNGWDETCLTEDADLGIRLTQAGANISISYDPIHATQEETPGKIPTLIKQRTRWVQGFLQIIAKGEYRKFPTVFQQFVALYILISQSTVALFILLTPFAVITALVIKLPILVTMVSFVPLILLGIQMAVLMIGFKEFTRLYNKPFQLRYLAIIFLFYLPYQFLLLLSTLRAIGRTMTKKTSWEKTVHLNLHRTEQLAFS